MKYWPFYSASVMSIARWHHIKVAPLCLVLAGLCAGCVSSTKPADDLGFANALHINQFVGCDQNRGDRGEGVPFARLYLSETIWPKAEMDHETIDSIQVAALSDDELRVSAVANRKIVRQETFVAGKDFTFTSGQISIAGESRGLAPTEPGSLVLGLAHTSTTLGVDPEGNGRILGSGSLVGTVALVVPIAFHGRDAIRFMRAPGVCPVN